MLAATAIATAPLSVSAAGPAKAPETASEDEALAEARALFERGQAKYETFDYSGAIDLWQQAYAVVPESQAGVRNAMVYNIALAQEKAYEVDHDPAHLRQAVFLLEEWVKKFKAMYKRTPETAAEVQKAQARIDELNAKLAALAGGGEPEPVATDPVPSASEIEFDSGYTPPPEVLKNRERIAAENRAEGFIAAGWTVGGIGALFALGGTGALIAASDNDAGLAGGIGGLVLGTGMLVTGGVLLGIGYKAKKKNKEAKKASVAFAPVVSPRLGGAAVRVRF